MAFRSNVTLSIREYLLSGAFEIDGYGSAQVTSLELPASAEDDEFVLGLSWVEFSIILALLFFIFAFLFLYWRRSRSKVLFLEKKLIETDHLIFDAESGPYPASAKQNT